MALNEETIRLEWKHVGQDKHFDGASLSDGSLRFIALATLLLQPQSLRPPLVLIDEPELGMHPSAVNLVASLVRSASVSTQVILATQSGHFVDPFEPGDLIVAERVRGATQLGRVDEKRLESWLKDYSLGELWEKAEFGGRPCPELY